MDDEKGRVSGPQWDISIPAHSGFALLREFDPTIKWYDLRPIAILQNTNVECGHSRPSHYQASPVSRCRHDPQNSHISSLIRSMSEKLRESVVVRAACKC